MYSDFRMSPGLDVWLGILPPQWDKEDFEDDEDFYVEEKRKMIHIRKSKFRRNS